jgi:hypothetical protein
VKKEECKFYNPSTQSEEEEEGREMLLRVANTFSLQRTHSAQTNFYRMIDLIFDFFCYPMSDLTVAPLVIFTPQSRTPRLP